MMNFGRQILSCKSKVAVQAFNKSQVIKEAVWRNTYGANHGWNGVFTPAEMKIIRSGRALQATEAVT